jgi:hypothetical protein
VSNDHPPFPKPPFTLIAGVGASLAARLQGHQQLNQAAANWDALGLGQILVGEADLPAQPWRQLVADVITTHRDEPCLAELLRIAAQHATADWLLLVSPDALLSPALVANLSQLCRPGSPLRVVVGRAWRLPESTFNSLASAVPEELERMIDAAGKLDAGDSTAWALLPRNVLQAAPAELGCNPAEAVPWLVRCAEQLGWPVLEATAAAPLACLAVRAHGGLVPPPPQAAVNGVVLPHRPGAPRLSLLLAAPEAELEALQQALRPAEALPWEVIARPAESSDGEGATAAAWNSALEMAQGALAWPITATLPPLALIPAVLRSFDRQPMDVLQLSWPLGRLTMPPHQPWHQEPGCLVTHTAWLRRLGGFDSVQSAGPALLQWRQQAERRGARCQALPLLAREGHGG